MKERTSSRPRRLVAFDITTEMERDLVRIQGGLPSKWIEKPDGSGHWKLTMADVARALVRLGVSRWPEDRDARMDLILESRASLRADKVNGKKESGEEE